MRSKFSQVYRIGLAVAALLLSFQRNLHAQSLYEGVCRMAYAAGWKAEGDLGHTICGEITSNKEEFKVFITSKEGRVYAHSNYKLPDPEIEYPSKVISKEPLDLAAIVANVTNDGEHWNEIDALVRDNIEFIVDINTFETKAIPAVDLLKANKVKFLLADGTVRNSGNHFQ